MIATGSSGLTILVNHSDHVTIGSVKLSRLSPTLQRQGNCGIILLPSIKLAHKIETRGCLSLAALALAVPGCTNLAFRGRKGKTSCEPRTPIIRCVPSM